MRWPAAPDGGRGAAIASPCLLGGTGSLAACVRLARADKLSPEEREALKRAFTRTAIGCECLWVSLLLFIISMMLVMIFYIQISIPSLELGTTPIVAAGALGAVGWVLGAVGVGLCMSGPP